MQYLADPGQRLAYHNAPYTILDNVLEQATGSDLSAYFQQKMGSKIGMTGLWQEIGLVLVRMGKNPDKSLIPLQYLNDIWGIIKE